MPYVNVLITKGATREQKAQLVKDITDSLVTVLGKKPEHTHVVFRRLLKKTGDSLGCLLMNGRKHRAGQEPPNINIQ